MFKYIYKERESRHFYIYDHNMMVYYTLSEFEIIVLLYGM